MTGDDYENAGSTKSFAMQTITKKLEAQEDVHWGRGRPDRVCRRGLDAR